jgi:hypothetical protein
LEAIAVNIIPSKTRSTKVRHEKCEKYREGAKLKGKVPNETLLNIFEYCKSINMHIEGDKIREFYLRRYESFSTKLKKEIEPKADIGRNNDNSNVQSNVLQQGNFNSNPFPYL